MANKNKEEDQLPNIVVLAARTPAGKMHLFLSVLAMVMTLVIVFIMDKFPETAIGAFFNRHVIILMLPGFLSMASIQQFSLVANAIRMDIENGTFDMDSLGIKK